MVPNHVSKYWDDPPSRVYQVSGESLVDSQFLCQGFLLPTKQVISVCRLGFLDVCCATGVAT